MEIKELIFWIVINNAVIFFMLFSLNSQIKDLLQIIDMIVMVIAGKGELKIVEKENQDE